MFVSAYLGRLIDSFSRAVLNSQVQRNRHRWKLSVSYHARNILEVSAKRVEWAWEIDKKDPKSYPLNTDYVFAEIDEQLSKLSHDRSQIEPQARKLVLPPRRFSDLLDEKIIKAVYEQQNDGSYEAALKLAVSGKGKGASAWRKIVRAVDATYMINRREVLPHLADFTAKQIRLAIDVSHPYATLIKRGDRTPHPRHWVRLAGLAGVSRGVTSAEHYFHELSRAAGPK